MIDDLHRQDAEDFRALLSTREGARFLCRLLDVCGVDRGSYTPAGDTHNMAFREGMRSVGLMLTEWYRSEPGGELAVIAARDERVRIFERGSGGKDG